MTAADLVDAPTDDHELRRAFACFPSGVVAVCAQVDGRPRGIAASTFVPVSLDPPLVSFCVQHSSTTWPALRGADRIGVSLLATGQHATARALATRGHDRFRDIELRPGGGDAVFVAGAPAWLECTVHAEVPAGDHSVVLLRIHRLAARAHIEPLVFHGSRFRTLHTGD
jgi:flavin reductase (DIM6/NTAB) family NADH-FMN oxidoreductase RutF